MFTQIQIQEEILIRGRREIKTYCGLTPRALRALFSALSGRSQWELSRARKTGGGGLVGPQPAATTRLTIRTCAHAQHVYIYRRIWHI